MGSRVNATAGRTLSSRASRTSPRRGAGSLTPHPPGIAPRSRCRRGSLFPRAQRARSRHPSAEHGDKAQRRDAAARCGSGGRVPDSQPRMSTPPAWMSGWVQPNAVPFVIYVVSRLTSNRITPLSRQGSSPSSRVAGVLARSTTVPCDGCVSDRRSLGRSFHYGVIRQGAPSRSGPNLM